MMIKKTLPLSAVKLELAEDKGFFSGYASVFSGVDSYGDTIEKGAFADTLKSGMPKMFFNHNWDMPIGKYTIIKEDEVGLFVEGELTPNLQIASDVRAAMKHGTLDGLSIGGYLRKGDYTDTDEGRIVHRWSSLMEISPVAFPADSAARIDLASVKSESFEAAIAELKTIRDIEYFLRDAGNFSKGAAQSLVARFKSITVQRDADADVDEMKAMASLLDRLGKLPL